MGTGVFCTEKGPSPRAADLPNASRMPHSTPTLHADGPRTLLAPLAPGDGPEFLRLAEASRAFHHPWVAPPRTEEGFAQLLGRIGDRFRSFALRRRGDGDLVGVFNLSEITRGALRSAYLGYYAFAPYAGQGLMGEGMHLLLSIAFGPLELHRVEANVRPENRASIRLVRRAGFEREGFSRAYLFLDGAWRDHERWAIREEIWTPPTV